MFLAFAALILAVLVVLPWMRSPAPASKAALQQSMGAAILGALRDKMPIDSTLLKQPA